MNQVNILFFATLKGIIGARTLQMELPEGATVGLLKDTLISEHPNLAPMRGSIMAAVNQEYAADDQVIPAQAEIAFFPPVSGG